MSTCGCSQPVAADPCPTQFSQPAEQGGFTASCDNPFIKNTIKLRVELPYEADGVDPFHEVCAVAAGASVLLPGDGTTAYDLILRIRGACEFNAYTGGVYLTDKVNEGGVGDGSNQFSLSIPGYGPSFFINGNQFGGPPDLWVFDYQYAIIAVPSNASIILQATSSGVQLSNRFYAKVPPPGVPPNPAWFDGQFLQIDCESALQHN